MAEVTEIWVWTVWEVEPVEAATDVAGTEAEPAAEQPESAPAEPAAEPQPVPETAKADAAPPVAGYAVEASDGHIGTVDEVSYDAGSGAIVVDTGHWIFGKKRMVPAGMIEKIDSATRVVTLSCTKADVKAAPDYDPSRADDASHRAEVGEHYQAQRDATGAGAEPAPEAH
jgi:hypothetical protein